MKSNYIWVFLAALVSFSFGFVTDELPTSNLRKFSIYKDAITMSGFSSGGTMAQHVQFSYSSLFSGIAVLSHSYYRCGPGDGNIANYVEWCTILNNPKVESFYNPKNAIKDIQNYFEQGLIENPANLANKKLYVYAGTKDYTFSTDQSLRIIDIYEPYLQNLDSVKVRILPANHNLATNNFGGPCETGPSYSNYSIANCGLSAPFEALNFLLGPEVVKFAPPSEGQKIQLEPLQSFNQTEFTTGIEGPHYLDPIGYFYIPKSCVEPGMICHLHFYFHGCVAGREFKSENHVRNSGYLEIAEQNGIIMIFPQTVSSEGNPGGCWDTFGLTGKLYATQHGAQVIAIRNMLARIMGEGESENF